MPAENSTKLALYFLIATAARTIEMRMATWGEIEGREFWRVPGERMKMRADHTVPLSQLALSILDKAKELRTHDGADALLFPGFTRAGPLSENALLALLARAGYFGRQTGHGFRAAFSTWANEAGADPTVIELCLAHQQGGVRGIYNRGGYVAQRKKLLDAWGKHLLAQGLRLP